MRSCYIFYMSFIIKNCLHCEKEFNAPVREVNRGNGKFCSRACSGAYNGLHRPKPENNLECSWCHIPIYRTEFQKTLSKSQLFFCSRACKDRAQALDGLKALHPPHFGSGISSYREIAFRIKDKVCERCGYDQHEAAIIVHHKDRNRNNNDISNLEVLCCNCHAIEHWGEE